MNSPSEGISCDMGLFRTLHEPIKPFTVSIARESPHPICIGGITKSAADWSDMEAQLSEAKTYKMRASELRAEVDRLKHALAYYADEQRHRAMNHPMPSGGDPYALPDAVYFHDIGRDSGAIARAALEAVSGKGRDDK